ncbi:MAG: hypothetical protein ACQKBU_04860, partial [Verrucomicrobiales bacterium]
GAYGGGGSEPLYFRPPVKAPSGFDPVLSIGLPGQAEVLRGWTFGVNGSVSYDSNVRRTSGGGGGDDGDVVSTVDLVATYRSPGESLWYSGSVRLGYSTYSNESSFNGFNYGLDGSAGYSGARLTTVLGLSLTFDRGGNHYFNDFTEQLRLTGNLSASYRISPKTSLTGSLSTDLMNPETEAGTGDRTGELQARLGADWQATMRTNLGAGLSWSQDGGQNHTTRNSFGPYMNVGYEASQKVSLNARFGIETASYDVAGADDDIDYEVNISANYKANDIWGMSLSVYAGTDADGTTPGAYRDSVSVQAGYNRKILDYALELTAGWTRSDQFQPVSFGPSIDTGVEDYLSFDASLSRPIPVIRGVGSVFLGYSDQLGGDGFESFRFGVNVGTSF